MRQPEYDLGKPARLSASTLLISAGISSDHSRTHAVLLLLRRPERFHCFPRTWRLPFEPRAVPGNCLFEIPRERGIVCHLAEVVDDVFHLSQMPTISSPADSKRRGDTVKKTIGTKRPTVHCLLWAMALVFHTSAFQIFRMVHCTVRCKGKVLRSAIRFLEALPFVSERYDSVGNESLRIC